MANSSIIVAIDVGTHAVRASIFEPTTMGLEASDLIESPLSLADLGDGHIEQDPAQFSRAFAKIFQHVTEKIGTRCCQFSIACQRSSVLAWDENTGEALSPVLSWQDTRGIERVNRLTQPTKTFIRENTGLPVNAHYGASKLAILTQEFSTHKNLRIGPLAAWLIRQLTRHSYCDVVSACRTLCANIRKSPYPQWDKKLCDIWHLSPKLLPAVVPCLFDYGEVSYQQTTLGTLASVTGDQNAAYLALRYQGYVVGFNNPLIINIGSGAFILGPLTSPTRAPDGLLTAPAYASATKTDWISEGTVNSCGTELTRWREANSDLSESALFQQLPSWLATSNDDIPLYLPTTAGLGSPFWVSRFKADSVNFFNIKGEPCSANLSQQAVAVVESIAFLIAANIEAMQNTQIPYDGIIFAGGLSRLSGLVERICQLAQLNGWVSDDFEATLLGTAIACDQEKHKASIKGRIVAAKNTVPLLKKRYQRYIALIQEQQD